MIDLEYIRSCSDQTFDYKAIIKKPMTVGEFIKEWMTTSPNEWGYFGIYDGKTIFGNPQCEYSKGKITTDPIPDEYLNAEIDEVNGNGGWSRNDFIFKIRRKPMQYNKDNRSITIDEALDDMNVLLERISNQNVKKGWVYIQDINPQAVDMAVSALESLNQAILDLERYEVKEDE